jgi:hypothetical protein
VAAPVALAPLACSSSLPLTSTSRSAYFCRSGARPSSLNRGTRSVDAGADEPELDSPAVLALVSFVFVRMNPLAPREAPRAPASAVFVVPAASAFCRQPVTVTCEFLDAPGGDGACPPVDCPIAAIANAVESRLSIMRAAVMAVSLKG